MTLPFRELLARGGDLFGVFAKTSSHQAIEVLGRTGVDYIVIDAEHAPFGPGELDICLLAAVANGLSVIVRVPELNKAVILTSLDLGAAGVMIPHIRDARQAAPRLPLMPRA